MELFMKGGGSHLLYIFFFLWFFFLNLLFIFSLVYISLIIFVPVNFNKIIFFKKERDLYSKLSSTFSVYFPKGSGGQGHTRHLQM